MEKKVKLHDMSFKIFISEEQIKKKVKEIANRINYDYVGKNPTLLVVLKGGMIFAADLMREITIGCSLDIIRAKSYGSEMESSGSVALKHFDNDIANKDIIIVEDIIDTGLTIKTLIEDILEQNPASLQVASFLSKPEARTVNIDIKYVGFEIPKFFVVGYGLDYAEYGRELKDIYILDDEH